MPPWRTTVEPAVSGLLARSDLPDFLRLDAEEQRELRQPLVEKRAPVDQDQRAATAVGHEVRADDRLADAGRRDEHADLVLEQRVRGLLLNWRQVPAKSEAERLAGDALVRDFEGHGSS
jgi:hypothetical protein